MIRAFRGFCLIAVAILTLVGCGTDEGFTDIVVPSGAIRVLNAIPDSPTLNVTLNGTPRHSLRFGSSSQFTPILPELVSDITVQYLVGDQVVDLFLEEPFTVGIDEQYTVIMTGRIDSPTLINIANPETVDAGENNFEVQLVNAATAVTGAVRYEFVQDGSVVSTTTLAPEAVSPTLTVAAGEYELVVRLNDSNAVLWRSGTITLTADQRGLFAMIDYFGPGDADVRMISIGASASSTFPDEDLPGAARVANMTSDQGPLDLYMDDVLIAENVAFTNVTAYMEVPVGTGTLKVTPHGDVNTVLTELSSQTLSPGRYQTIVLSGLDDEHSLQVYPDDIRRVPTRVQLTATNASRSQTGMDLYLVEPGRSINDEFPRVSTMTRIPSSTSSHTLVLQEDSFDFVLTTGASDTIISGPTLLDFANNGIYSMYFVDGPDGESIEVIFKDDFNL